MLQKRNAAGFRWKVHSSAPRVVRRCQIQVSGNGLIMSQIVNEVCANLVIFAAVGPGSKILTQ